MTPNDLFLPLVLAAGISFIALIAVYFFVTEPIHDDDCLDNISNNDAPEKLDRFTFVTIVLGSFIDNVGSLGIVRKCLAGFISGILQVVVSIVSLYQ